MASRYLPPLETRSLNSTRPRRGSSFRRRSKQSHPGSSEVAVHVLLPKIFGGQLVPSEYESESDDGEVSSPDSAVMVATSQGMEDIPFITLSSPDEPTYRLSDAPPATSSNVLPVSSNHRASKYPRKDDERVNTVGVMLKPAVECDGSLATAAAAPRCRPRNHKPPRPRLDRRGAPYTPDSRSPAGSNESTPRMRCQDQKMIRPNPAAVNQLSVALDHFCHLAEGDNVRCAVDHTVTEDNKPFNGFLSGSAVNRIGGKRPREKTILANGKELRGGEIVFNYEPKLREAASWRFSKGHGK
ncbi:hypothetical protein M409DRAFT_53271 [Zasmidium cellare ATCC 36951]|uniref:Uncharacterized protein n=1 Tax=Zasmidium cellare ATCC 36951 TaxID=1080233 RepID=A0A6A6CS31_ZASCE|nr:uncharacterized protein M409DRAFT_53271 [Zasmidium cellare ATCC 36951]KAF2168632.1 hypothetical protein M409DRAFT_53271 [Zasmidium cellare ATCC 36951]